MTDKAFLRKELLAKRDGIPPEVRRAKSRMIREKIGALAETNSGTVILFFASFRSEVDTTGMMQDALGRGQIVAVPRVEKERHTLLLYRIEKLDELSPGYMGIPEPAATAEMAVGIESVDVVVIPGAGFDLSGNRIGYGGGYYDRLLSGLTREIRIVAPAFEEQLVDAVPAEPHDVQVGIIVTDRRVIRTV